MKRRKRTEILIKGSPSLAQELSEEIERNYDVKVIESPENGLVMVKMRESAQKSLFYLGEVFITEAKVQIEGKLGIGVVTGSEPELAYHLAVVDAAYNGDLKETLAWEQLLVEEEMRIKAYQSQKELKIMQTKVNFETMDV